MKEVAKGNLFIEPSKISSKDEFGELQISFNTMTDKLRNQVIRAQFLKDREAFLKQIMVYSISSLDIKDTIRTIVTKTGEFFKADRCYYVEYDPQTQEHLPIKDYAIYLSSLSIENISGSKPTKEEMQPVIRYVFGQRQTLAISNVDEVNIPDATRNLFKAYGIKSFLAAPIIYRDVIIGRLGIQYIHNYKQFTQDDIDIVSAITDQSATAIHQAKLYCQIEETKNRESSLKNIISNTLLSSNLDEAMKTMSTEIGKLFNADRTCFLLFDSTWQAFSEIKGEYRRREDMPSTEGTVILNREFEQYLIEELFVKKNVLVLDSSINSKFPELLKDFAMNIGIKVAVAVPIFYRDKPIAIILIKYTESMRHWSKEELDFLVPLAQQISIGINLFQLNDRLCKTLASERAVKDIVIGIRKLEDYHKIWDYILNRLTDIYGVDRALNLRFTPECDLLICNEVIKNMDQASSLGQDVSKIKNTLEILSDEPDKVIVKNDIDKDIKDPVLKEYFLNKGVYSLLVYPVASITVKRHKIEAVIMLCSSTSRKWTSYEVDSFKLMIDTTTLVYLEIRQRQEAEDQRKTFLATLTHDLRSPLLAEQKALEAILAKRMGLSLEDYSEYLQEMHKTNDALLRIVDNLLMTYHYEAGKTELELKPSNINDIIYNAVNSMKPLAKDNDSEIFADSQPDLPLVMANSDEISRVIINLINNAIKHNTKGTNINVAAKKADNEVQVSVSDNGKGIPESERSKIFQRYPTTKRMIGSGLGLYLSKQIIDAHHGKIWFETEEGKGTTFYFNLPIS